MPKKASELNQSILPFFFFFFSSLFLFFSFFFSPSLFIFFYPQEEKTACVQRVHLPFRDAYCTLDDAIYRSWALAGSVCVVLACVHNSTDECDARLISPGTKRSDPMCTDFRKRCSRFHHSLSHSPDQG